MFNRQEAEQAKQRLKRSADTYNRAQARLQDGALKLYELRVESGKAVISEAAAYISLIAGHPKKFDDSVRAFKFEFKNFTTTAKKIEAQYQDAALKAGVGAGVGVAAGAATALMGPTAAIAIATTFGTASTGTAIATLSGAAATNAALAWLGGGAIAAGGGGMASGTALLALAGPVGWTAAGVVAAGGLFYFSSANAKVAREANSRAYDIERATKTIELSSAYIEHLASLTNDHINGLRALLDECRSKFPRSYRNFTKTQLETVAALVNHVNALSELLKKTVETYLNHVEAAERTKPTWLRSSPSLQIEHEAALNALRTYGGPLPAGLRG